MAEGLQFLIAVPAFNEAGRIGFFLGELLDRVAASGLRAEVLVVDDGSRPREAEEMARIVEACRARHPELLRPVMRLERNRGKGGAVYAAWAGEQRARWLAFVDADGAIPPGEVVRLLEMAAGSGDPGLCLAASRVKMLGRTVRRRLHRHLVGRVFATFVHLLTASGAYDTQCGFKIVPREMFRRVAPLLRERRFCFDVELICRLERAGARIIEVPIDWSDKPGGKVRLLRDSLDMGTALLRIRRRLMSAEAPDQRGETR